MDIKKQDCRWETQKNICGGLAIGIILVIALIVKVNSLVPILGDDQTDMLTKIVSLYYPIGDFVLIIPAVLLILFTAHISRRYACAALGNALRWRFFFGARRISYIPYMARNDLYSDGNMIDILWNISYLLIAAGRTLSKINSCIDSGRRLMADKTLDQKIIYILTPYFGDKTAAGVVQLSCQTLHMDHTNINQTQLSALSKEIEKRNGHFFGCPKSSTGREKHRVRCKIGRTQTADLLPMVYFLLSFYPVYDYLM